MAGSPMSRAFQPDIRKFKFELCWRARTKAPLGSNFISGWGGHFNAGLPATTGCSRVRYGADAHGRRWSAS